MLELIKKQKANAKNDILAGITVSLAMIPEVVAFAFVAQISPIVALFGAFVVGIISAVFGGRPGLISGAAGAVGEAAVVARRYAAATTAPTAGRVALAGGIGLQDRCQILGIGIIEIEDLGVAAAIALGIHLGDDLLQLGAVVGIAADDHAVGCCLFDQTLNLLCVQ